MHDVNSFDDVRQSTGRFRKIMARLQKPKSGTEGRRAETSDLASSRTRELAHRRSNGVWSYSRAALRHLAWSCLNALESLSQHGAQVCLIRLPATRVHSSRHDVMI